MSNILQSIPSQMKIRDELERMVLADLLGPTGGEAEEIDDPSVRERYLIGMLAPREEKGSGATVFGTKIVVRFACRSLVFSTYSRGLA